MKDNKEVLAGKESETIRIHCISSGPNFGKKKTERKVCIYDLRPRWRSQSVYCKYWMLK